MDKPSPLLSVIIACFNYEAFVGRAIDSVLSQKHAACELLVVDDGSTDGSWDIIQSYGLASCYQVPNGGAAKACFHAFQHSRAPFVLFLDADDELAPGSIARIVARLDAGVAKLQFPLIPIDADGKPLGPPSPRLRDDRQRNNLKREVARTGAYTSPPTSGNVFCRRLCALLPEVEYETWVDGVTLFAAPFFGDIVSLSEPLGFYRLHQNNHSQSGIRANPQRFRNEAERFLARHDHLRRILAREREPVHLRDGQDMFFYRERLLYADLLQGSRPTLTEVLSLQWLVLTSGGPPTYRVALIVFLPLCMGLPKRMLRALVEYRFQRGGRSLFGLARCLFARPAPYANVLGPW